MEREKINKAAQLTDDLKKVSKALELMDGNNRIAIRVSANVGTGEEMLFAYLPKSILPGVRALLVEAQNHINQNMDDL